MTEAEWLACTDPDWMLDHLAGDRISERKLRLLACACVEHAPVRRGAGLYSLFTDARSRDAVAVALRFADGEATAEERAAARDAAWAVGCRPARTGLRPGRLVEFGVAAVFCPPTVAWDPASRAARAVTRDAAWDAAKDASWDVARAAADDGPWDAARRFEAALIRDVFGNPFRRPPGGDSVGTAHDPEGDGRRPAVSPGILAWHGGLVVALARGIYADCRFGDRPVLADALEEAGCSAGSVLSHCRHGGPHALGCWALDLVLDRG